MDTIQLLAKYNSKEKSLVDKITTFTMATCVLLYFVSVYFYPLKFSFLLFGLAYILAIFCSPRRNRERIENKIKKSVYCGDLKSIFNLENKRTLQVIKDFKNEIEHDISNYFGLKGETILKMLEEIKVWEKYDLEKTNKADFKEAFENTPTRIGKMFEQINNLKKEGNMKIDNQLFLNYIEYKNSLSHDELVQKEVHSLYYIMALPAIIVFSIYLQFLVYFILSNVIISTFVSQEYLSNIQKISFNYENISYVISLFAIAGIFYTFSQKYFMPKLNSWIKRKFGISEIDIFANFIYKDRIEKLFVDSAERNIVFKRNFYEIKENILTHSGLSLELINKCIIKIQYAKENAIELSVNNTDRIFNDFVFTDIEIALMEANTKVGSLLNELKTIINTK